MWHDKFSNNETTNLQGTRSSLGFMPSQLRYQMAGHNEDATSSCASETRGLGLHLRTNLQGTRIALIFSRRGQTAFEFLLLVAVAFLIFIVFTYSTREEFTKAQTGKEYALVKDLAFSLQSEVNRASTIEDGYRRTFKLPNDLEGYEYNTSILNNTLIVRSQNYEFTAAVYPVTGNFTNGTNTIRKTSGTVYLNS